MENKKIKTAGQSNKNEQRRSGGFALALVLCVIILILIAGTGMMSIGMHNRRFSVYNCSEISARSAADSGLTKSIFEMNKLLERLILR